MSLKTDSESRTLWSWEVLGVMGRELKVISNFKKYELTARQLNLGTEVFGD
ncbi:MAG: hypothetical protein N2235_23525 [Fischerella sp.]|nr:hypothetical protein [Fischerella sp.]